VDRIREPIPLPIRSEGGLRISTAHHGRHHGIYALLSTDAIANLAAALAEKLGVDAATLTIEGEPRLRVVVGRRAKLGGTVRVGGASEGSFRVKLSGNVSN